MGRRITPQQPRHGHSRRGCMSPTYMSWANMLRRCRDPNSAKFPAYGGRGIEVCARWVRFDEFLADMGEKPEGLTLDRADVDGNYEPGNCRWASAKTQANNKTTNRIVEWAGRAMTVSQWADELGVPFVTLRMRLHRGWSVERSFTQPLRIWP